MIQIKWLWQTIGVIVFMTLTGCVTPTTPFPTQSQAVTKSPEPTQTEAVAITPASTQISIASFEECAELGNPIQSTFPRQCTTTRNEIFTEALPEGIIFSKVYGENRRSERPAFITSTMDGGYIITGTANFDQCLIRKLNSSGQQEWEHKLGQELREEFQFVNASFTCWSAAQSSDGEYGVLVHGANGIIGNYFIIRIDRYGKRGPGKVIAYRQGMSLQLDKEGYPLWVNSFGLGGQVIETSDGGYTFVGGFPNDSPDSSTHIFKTDMNGTYLWEKNLCRDKNVRQAWEEEIVCSYDYLRDAIQSQDGGYVFVGGLSHGVWLVKTDSLGSIEWIKSYMPESNRAIGRALIQTPDGGFLIAGEQQGDGMLIKTDGAGNMQWSRTFGGGENDEFITIEQFENGETIVMGSTKSFGEGSENTWLLGIDLSAFR